MKIKDISRLKERATVGHADEQTLPNGNVVPVFVPDYRIRCGYYHYNVTETIANVSNKTIDISILTRDNKKLYNPTNLMIKLDGVTYNVIATSPDNTINGMMRIDLKRATGNGIGQATTTTTQAVTSTTTQQETTTTTTEALIVTPDNVTVSKYSEVSVKVTPASYGNSATSDSSIVKLSWNSGHDSLSIYGARAGSTTVHVQGNGQTVDVPVKVK